MSTTADTVAPADALINSDAVPHEYENWIRSAVILTCPWVAVNAVRSVWARASPVPQATNSPKIRSPRESASMNLPTTDSTVHRQALSTKILMALTRAYAVPLRNVEFSTCLVVFGDLESWSWKQHTPPHSQASSGSRHTPRFRNWTGAQLSSSRNTCCAKTAGSQPTVPIHTQRSSVRASPRLSTAGTTTAVTESPPQ